MSALECLRAATSNAAAALDLHDRGRVEAGARADLLVLQGDAEADLSCLEQPLEIVRGGVTAEAANGRSGMRQARVYAAVLKGALGTLKDVFC